MFSKLPKTRICAGRLELAVAQQQIMTDWYSAWLAIPAKSKIGT